MPCYSRIESTVELGQNTDPLLLAKAMQALGYEVERLGQKPADGFAFAKGSLDGEFVGGRLTFWSVRAIDQNEIKRAYSTEVVKATAQRFGWQVKQASPNKFQLSRRA